MSGAVILISGLAGQADLVSLPLLGQMCLCIPQRSEKQKIRLRFSPIPAGLGCEGGESLAEVSSLLGTQWWSQLRNRVSRIYTRVRADPGLAAVVSPTFKRKLWNRVWHTPVIPAVRTVRQEDCCKFETSLECILLGKPGLQSETLSQKTKG